MQVEFNQICQYFNKINHLLITIILIIAIIMRIKTSAGQRLMTIDHIENKIALTRYVSVWLYICHTSDKQKATV